MTAATRMPIGTIAVVTKPTSVVRIRVGVNSSVSGTAITATSATPAPTTTAAPTPAAAHCSRVPITRWAGTITAAMSTRSGRAEMVG